MRNEVAYLSPADFSVPDIKLPDSVANPAKWAYERIIRSIIDFEARLDQEHEIGARLVCFGSSEVIHIENVGYWGPHMIKFSGRNVEGQPVELIQHVTQFNVLLIAVKKQFDEPRRYGFQGKE